MSEVLIVDDSKVMRDMIEACLRPEPSISTTHAASGLEAIEQLSLEPLAEWARFEAFAPFALAFFDSLLAAPLAANASNAELARMRREVDAVLAPLATALTSSAMAA